MTFLHRSFPCKTRGKSPHKTDYPGIYHQIFALFVRLILQIRHRQCNIASGRWISICDFLLFVTKSPSEMSEMCERFLPFLSILFCFIRKHSEFFWIKVKRFSEFHFTAKFWSFFLKKPFRMVGDDKIFRRHFFFFFFFFCLFFRES